jgi:ABC-type spermidine/putrescine transport system permease subunit II
VAVRRLSKSTAVLFVVAAIALVIVVGTSPVASRQALFNSAWLAAGTLALALPLGTLLAVLIARCDVFGRRSALTAIVVLLVTPL